jgi:hypothetical protein
MMWGDHGEVRCCGLNKVEIVETVGFRQTMWLVMLKSAKGQILGVDIPVKQVPPRVQYGMTCLLIRDAVGCVPSSNEWKVARSFAQAYMVQEEPWYRVLPRETLALLRYHELPYQSLACDL